MDIKAIIKRMRVICFGGLTGVEDIERLKKRGLKLGRNVSIMEGVVFDSSHCWLITVGDNVTFAPSVHVLAHDASMHRALGYTKIGLVSIGSNTFIGARTVILPGVKIGANVIIGAGSIVTKDIPDGNVAVGNPAKVVLLTEEFLARNKTNMEHQPLFSADWTLRGGISDAQKAEMIRKLQNCVGYVE